MIACSFCALHLEGQTTGLYPRSANKIPLFDCSDSVIGDVLDVDTWGLCSLLLGRRRMARLATSGTHCPKSVRLLSPARQSHQCDLVGVPPGRVY